MNHFQSLESRRLCSADPSFALTSKGTLIVTGSDADDAIKVDLVHGQPSGGVRAVISNITKSVNDIIIYHNTRADFRLVKRISIDGGAGNDQIEINGSP